MTSFGTIWIAIGVSSSGVSVFVPELAASSV
jgi:hypothetical protein